MSAQQLQIVALSNPDQTPTDHLIPLAHRIRPQTLDEVVGQPQLTAKKSWFHTMIENQRAISAIFWGPPGVGKTTLAHIMAKAATLPMEYLSAVSAGKKEVQQILDHAKSTATTHLLFLDEIHRFNKSQQDVLLPAIENGTIILVGATTENPSFSLNNALLSRCRVVVLNTLDTEAIVILLQRACSCLQQQYPQFDIDSDALQWLATMADGDGRYVLNLVEELALSHGSQHWNRQQAELVLSRKAANYDRDGDFHYDLISALHKSVRDSDADAACYWLARMLEAGEQPHYLLRRLIRMASEDIGLADPRALTVCLDALRMYDMLGSPEGEQGIFEAAIYLALAPKSNATYMAEKAARKLAKATQQQAVPIHLRNAPTKLMKDLGHGADYQYAHNATNAVVNQSHFPDGMTADTLYQPTQRGFERTLGERIQWLAQQQQQQA